MNALRLCLGVVLLTLFAGATLATGTLRCATHLIDQGTTRDEVVKYCGQPTARKKNDRYWYYEHGSSMLVTRLFFVDDKVQFINEVSRDEME